MLADAEGLFDDDLGCWKLDGLEGRAVDGGCIEGIDAEDGGVEFVEYGALDHVGDLGSDAAEGFVFFDVNGAMGFSDGLEDGFFIEGTDGSDIHHFRADAVFGFKDFSGFQAGDDRATVGDEGDVAALAFDIGDTEGDEEFAVGQFVVGRDIPFFTVEFGALHEHDGIVVADGGLHEAFGVIGV